MEGQLEYVRFRSCNPDRSGFHVGIFGLVNVLGRHGMLTADEERFRQENNAWYDAAYPDPGATARGVYGPGADPRAAAWFKSTATMLIARTGGYLAILDAHAIAWEQVSTTEPGTVIYEDSYQVVAIPPHPHRFDAA